MVQNKNEKQKFKLDNFINSRISKITGYSQVVLEYHYDVTNGLIQIMNTDKSISNIQYDENRNRILKTVTFHQMFISISLFFEDFFNSRDSKIINS